MRTAITNFLLRILFRLTDYAWGKKYDKIDVKAAHEWLERSFHDKGFRSYFAYEDMRILKSLGAGQPQDKYYELVGRRYQLLTLFDEMRKTVESKNKNDKK